MLQIRGPGQVLAVFGAHVRALPSLVPKNHAQAPRAGLMHSQAAAQRGPSETGMRRLSRTRSPATPGIPSLIVALKYEMPLGEQALLLSTQL